AATQVGASLRLSLSVLRPQFLAQQRWAALVLSLVFARSRNRSRWVPKKSAGRSGIAARGYLDATIAARIEGVGSPWRRIVGAMMSSMQAPQPAPTVHQAVRPVEVGIVRYNHQEWAGEKVEQTILGDVRVNRQHAVQLPERNAGTDR